MADPQKIESAIEKGYKAVVILLLSVLGWLIFNFWTEWQKDEAVEELEAKVLQFDTAGQKQEHINHVTKTMSPEDQKVKALRDEDFQKMILKEIKNIDSINKLNADQMYQIKQEIKNIH